MVPMPLQLEVLTRYVVGHFQRKDVIAMKLMFYLFTVGNDNKWQITIFVYTQDEINLEIYNRKILNTQFK